MIDKEKLKTYINDEISVSNKSNCSGEPWERGYRAGLKAIQKDIESGFFDKEVISCKNATTAVTESSD